MARDVVGHLVEWVPGFLSHFAGISVADLPTATDDPVAAWRAWMRPSPRRLRQPMQPERSTVRWDR